MVFFFFFWVNNEGKDMRFDMELEFQILYYVYGAWMIHEQNQRKDGLSSTV